MLEKYIKIFVINQENPNEKELSNDKHSYLIKSCSKLAWHNNMVQNWATTKKIRREAVDVCIRAVTLLQFLLGQLIKEELIFYF